MNCFLCKGEMENGTTTHFAQAKNCCVIIKNVPCMKCTQCGEVVYTASVTKRLDEIISELGKTLTEIAVVNYSAA